MLRKACHAGLVRSPEHRMPPRLYVVPAVARTPLVYLSSHVKGIHNQDRHTLEHRRLFTPVGPSLPPHQMLEDYA